MLEEYINKLRPLVLDLVSKDRSGHNIDHLERTMKIALFLQEHEGGDRIVIGIAAFLHDIHRIMQNEEGKFISPKDSLGKIMEILNSIDLEEEKINKILHSIEYHEVYNWNNENNNYEDINTLILQDADNLEAIGATGIARSFLYSGANLNQLIYRSDIPLDNSFDFIEGQKEVSTIHHFYHKSLKLADNMNTNTARKLANKRIEFMKEYIDEFLKEWNMEK